MGGGRGCATLHTPIANAASPFVMQTANHTAPHTHIFIVAHSHFHALSLSLLLTLGPTGQRYQFATFASPGYRRRRRTRRCAFKGHIWTLADDHVRAGGIVQYVWWHCAGRQPHAGTPHTHTAINTVMATVTCDILFIRRVGRAAMRSSNEGRGLFARCHQVGSSNAVTVVIVVVVVMMMTLLVGWLVGLFIVVILLLLLLLLCCRHHCHVM